MHATLPLLVDTDFPPLRRAGLEAVQLNMGYVCNQSCTHCHVSAGPNRTESLSAETADLVLAFIDAARPATLDMTGGAPELNPNFRRLAGEARRRGMRVIDRCNLTVLAEPGQEDLAEFLAAQRIDVVASLPCYLEDNVDRQRGKGVYAGSIAGLRRLNELGYGRDGSGLRLDLVYNPQGPSLPPPQQGLEGDYRRELKTRFDVEFSSLLTLANMPVGRFGSILVSKGQFDDYMTLLRGAHRADNVQNVMCRSLISIDWRGHVYDCDFNQMLGLPLKLESHPGDLPGGRETHLSELLGEDLTGNRIVVRDHCYGCTAGQGSSCGGALV